MMTKKLLEKAIEEAQKSQHQHKVGAVIFSKKRIVSKGHNKTMTWKRNLHPNFKKWPTSIHAEAMAILNARTDLKGCDILVVRVNKQGKLGLAFPCKYCMAYLEYVGIDKIYYSTGNMDRIFYISSWGRIIEVLEMD